MPDSLREDLEDVVDDVVEEESQSSETETTSEPNTVVNQFDDVIQRLSDLVTKATDAVSLLQSLIPETITSETSEVTTPTESTSDDITELDKRIMEGWLN